MDFVLSAVVELTDCQTELHDFRLVRNDTLFTVVDATHNHCSAESDAGAAHGCASVHFPAKSRITSCRQEGSSHDVVAYTPRTQQ